MELNLTPQLLELSNLFERKLEVIDEINLSISDKISPTVLAGIAEVVEVQLDAITILDVDAYVIDEGTPESQRVLLVTCMIEYASESVIPLLMHEISPPVEYGQDPLRRMLRVAIPFNFVFDSKGVIRDMLRRTLISDLTNDEISEFADNMDELSNVINLGDYKGTLQ